MSHSTNEWGKLKKVILGTIKNFHWSENDKVFRNLKNAYSYSNPVPNHFIQETEEDLNVFEKSLLDLGVEVLRPKDLDYASLDGFGCYCPRDTVLVLGNKQILTPTIWPQRRVEWPSIIDYFENPVEVDDKEAIFDAANIIRCNNELLYLVSYSGNEQGADWIENNFPEYNVHRLRNVYANMHLDTTIVPLREGLVMLNSARVKEEDVPLFMKSWDKIWIYKEDIVNDNNESKSTSPWIGMNLFNYDESTVFGDPKQTNIIKKLEKHGIETIGVNLRHSKYFMGGHHCSTLDLERE